MPASASVLLLVIALERQSRRRLWLFVCAGVLAGLALLIKQSFLDALAAGAVAVVAGKFVGVPWRSTLQRAGAYLSGVALVAAGLVAWATLNHRSASSVYYAIFGFRVDATHALAGDASGKITQLGSPALESGLFIALLVALVGIARLRERPVVRAVLVVWILVAGVGIVLGGSYFPHYLIALVPVAAAGAAAALVHRPRFALAGVAAMALSAVILAAPTAIKDSGDYFDESAVSVGHYIHDRALPGQTAYVLYAKVNLIYYSGLRPGFPYN